MANENGQRFRDHAFEATEAAAALRGMVSYLHDLIPGKEAGRMFGLITTLEGCARELTKERNALAARVQQRPTPLARLRTRRADGCYEAQWAVPFVPSLHR